MKGKSPQNSTVKSKQAKAWTHYDDYFCLDSFKLVPISHERVLAIFNDYLHWAFTEEKALKVEKFARLRHIPRSTFYHWMKRNPEFKLLHAEAKAAIGDRREELAFLKKADASIFMVSAPHYDYDAPDMSWKELLEAKAALNEASATKSAIYLVEDEARKKTPEQVASEVHAKTKKYVKPKYEVRAPNPDKEDEE